MSNTKNKYITAKESVQTGWNMSIRKSDKIYTIEIVSRHL